MTAEIVNYEDVAARHHRDRMAFRLRLAGMPVRQIAQELKCEPADVQGSLMRMCAGVTPELRARAVEMELERLDDMQQVFYLKMRNDSSEEAGALVLRIMERRAKLLGLDAPPRGDTAIDEAMPRPQTSVDRIRAAIERVARGPVIDAEAVEAEVVEPDVKEPR